MFDQFVFLDNSGRIRLKPKSDFESGRFLDFCRASLHCTINPWIAKNLFEICIAVLRGCHRIFAAVDKHEVFSRMHHDDLRDAIAQEGGIFPGLYDSLIWLVVGDFHVIVLVLLIILGEPN